MDKASCPLCTSNAPVIKEIGKTSEPKYYHCHICDLIFIEDRFILSPEEESKRYALHNNERENEGYVNMFKRFIDKAVKPFLPGLKNGLDFGCGPGPVLAELLSEMGLDMDVYDPYFYSDRGFLEKKYDLITATEVLEHLRYPCPVIQMLKGLLNKKGIICIMTLFHGNDDFKNWWYKQDPTHICFYSPATFAWIAKHFALKIAYINEKNICVLQS